MPYVVAFGMRNKKEFSTAEFATAREALKTAEDLQRSDEEIKYVDTPEGRFHSLDMLRVLAKEEAARK